MNKICNYFKSIINKKADITEENSISYYIKQEYNRMYFDKTFSIIAAKKNFYPSSDIPKPVSVDSFFLHK